MGIFGIYRACLTDDPRQDAIGKWRTCEAPPRAPPLLQHKYVFAQLRRLCGSFAATHA
jgi:hypothetical protein